MHRQWVVTLQNLPEAGQKWSADMPADLLENTGVGAVDALSGLDADVHWEAELVPNGDMYRLNGCWHMSMKRHCSRCSGDFIWHQDGLTERCFHMVGSSGVQHVSDDEAGDGGYDVIAPPGNLDLVDVLREDVWLAWKPDVICSEDCKGLCPQCGCNLNKVSCACAQEAGDHPFAALRGLKLN
ncbi:MAG: DUF177 domain-containing protein [Mariprofundaceae bacterium]